ncbi:hypothetical protein PTTG_30752, partial [Puccinia triticina 1-1 BBBD Race 1]
YVSRDHDIVRTSQRRTSQRSILKLYRYTSIIAQGGQPTINPIDPALSASSARRPHPAITGLIADVRSRETSIARGSTAAVEQQLLGEPIRLNSTVRGGSPDSIASIIVVTEPSG